MNYNLYQLGRECYDNENIEKALEYFFRSLAVEPHFKTYEMIYHCLSKLGKKHEAREYIEKAYNENKNNDKVAVEYSTVIFDDGNIDLSAKLLNEVLQRNPTYGPAKKLLEKIRNLE